MIFRNFLNLITNEITPELLEIAKKSYGGGYSASCGIFDRTRALYDNCDCEFTCDRSKPPPNTVNNAHAKYRNSKPEEEYYVMTDSSNQGSVFGCRIPITMEQYELEIYKCSKAKIWSQGGFWNPSGSAWTWIDLYFNRMINALR